MRRRKRLISGLVGSIALALGACTKAPPTGSFTPVGYSNPIYSYTVAYSSAQAVLPAGWRLDNFATTPSGLAPRTEPAYTTATQLDGDGDRAPEVTLRFPTYDLRYLHEAHPGVIFLRTVPYSYHRFQQNIDELARDYAARMAIEGVETALLDDATPAGAPRATLSITQEVDWSVAGHPARALALEVTQLVGQPSKAHGWIVLLRPGFMYQHTSSRQDRVLFPVLLVAGYLNAPEHFAAGRPDFEALLRQITVQGVAGFTPIQPLEVTSEPSTSPAPTAPTGPSTTPEAPPGTSAPATASSAPTPPAAMPSNTAAFPSP